CGDRGRRASRPGVRRLPLGHGRAQTQRADLEAGAFRRRRAALGRGNQSTSGGTMSIGQSMLPEFDQEMTTTRRLLERGPSEKGEWKPHPKSFSLGHLAQLVSRMPGWLPNMVKHDALDLSAAPAYSQESTKTLLGEFDQLVAEARATLGSVSDAELGK